MADETKDPLRENAMTRLSDEELGALWNSVDVCYLSEKQARALIEEVRASRAAPGTRPPDRAALLELAGNWEDEADLIDDDVQFYDGGRRDFLRSCARNLRAAVARLSESATGPRDATGPSTGEVARFLARCPHCGMADKGPPGGDIRTCAGCGTTWGLR